MKRRNFLKIIYKNILLSLLIMLPLVSEAQTNNTSRTEQEIKAELSKFTLEYDPPDPLDAFVFTLDIDNLTTNQITVYAFVFGRNDDFVPFRRGIWPLFIRRSSRSLIHHRDISNSWNSRSEMQKGAKVILDPNESYQREGALIINKICHYEPWRGQKYKPGSMYYERLTLWIFSDAGQLILKKEYTFGRQFLFQHLLRLLE